MFSVLACDPFIFSSVTACPSYVHDIAFSVPRDVFIALNALRTLLPAPPAKLTQNVALRRLEVVAVSYIEDSRELRQLREWHITQRPGPGVFWVSSKAAPASSGV